MDWLTFVERHIPEPASVTVEVYQGHGPYGPVYGPEMAVTPCVVEDTARLVRVQTQDAAGAEQVSSTTVYAPPEPKVPPGSRVTLATGHRTRVLAAAWLDAHGHPLPEHWELSLE